MDTIKIDPVGAPMADKLAAQNGTYGMAIPVMDTTARYVSFTDPTAETEVTVECEFDPNSLVMGNGENFYLVSGDVDFFVRLYYLTASGYYLQPFIREDDLSYTNGGYTAISDGVHKIRVVWEASSGVGNDDGYMKLYIDDVFIETLDEIDNDTLNIDSIHFGGYASVDAGTYGIFYMDDCKWTNWADISSDVIGNITGNWGFMKDDPTVFMADTGVFNLTLNNDLEIFIPGLTGSLAGWGKDTPVRVHFLEDSISKRKIYGTVDSIKIPKEPFSNKRVGVIVTDWFDYAATHPMISPDIETDVRGDEMLDTILLDIPIQPLDTDFSIGSVEFETGFDTVRFNSKAYSEMSKVGVSELGQIYIIKDSVYGETLVFESAWDRNGLITPPSLTFDNNMTSLEVAYGENITNRFINIANPRYIEGSAKVLYALGSPIRIGIGETIFVRGNYTDPSGGAGAVGANMIPAVITTDYLMYNAKTGGSNKTAFLTITETYGAAGVIYELTNGSTDVCYMTKLQARGYLVYKYNVVEQSAEDSDSQDEYGIIQKKIDQKYQKDPYLGHQYGERLLDDEKEPRVKLQKVNFIANRSDALMSAWLTQDVGDLVTIKESQKEIDGDFFIQGIKFSISTAGIVHFSWIVRDMYDTLENGGLTPVIQDQTPATPGEIGFEGLHFGQLPQISADGIVDRTISCWAYIEDLPAFNEACGMITTTVAGALGGWGFNYYTDDAGAPKLATLIYINHRWSGDSLVWWSDPSLIAEDTLYHFAVSIEDFDQLASNPILYIDAVAVGSHEETTPTGSFGSEESADLVFGNLAGYQFPHSGTIQDVRIYNEVLTPTEIATLYSDGVHGAGITRGMVFHGPMVKTKNLSYWEDHVMVAGDQVTENMYRALGEAAGTITIRLVP